MKYIDMHCDTITKMFLSNEKLSHNDNHIDIQKLKKGECFIQNFAIFTNLAKEDSSFTKKCIDFYYSELNECKDDIAPVLKYEDIFVNESNCKINSLLTLEEGSIIDGDLNNLQYYYDKGVRMITLTWNYYNGIGYPNFDLSKPIDGNPTYINDTKNGLTDFGIEFIRRCEELGIIVDVSHLSDKGFYDVLNNTTKPFVASHSGARTVCRAVRNLTDDMIEKLANRGGVTGVNFCPSFISEDINNHTTVDGIVNHIRHIVNVGGIECIGIGSDFDGIGGTQEIKDASGMQMLYEALRKYYSDDDIEKIFYKNVLRVYKDCLK